MVVVVEVGLGEGYGRVLVEMGKRGQDRQRERKQRERVVRAL